MKRGFTLIELLAAVLILLLVVGLSFAAYVQVSQAENLSTAAETVASALQEAHDAAQSRNLPVEIRFYMTTTVNDPQGAYRAVQPHVEQTDGTTPGLTAPFYLPEGMVMDSTAAHSTLLAANTNVPTSDPSDPHLNAQTKVFHCLPDGSTDLDPGTRWFITVRAETAGDPAHFPANWACVQVDATTGRVEVYRP